MKSILTLSTLIETLSTVSKSDYQTVFESYKFDRNELLQFENWSQDTYVRNGIYKDANFEIILLCWEKGQQTTIHCHNGEECWVYVLEGAIEEIKFSKDDHNHLTKLDTCQLCAHQRSYITDAIGLHQLKNSYNGRTMSLHLYAKPIMKCHYYDEVTQTFISKTLHYDTYKGETLAIEHDLF